MCAALTKTTLQKGIQQASPLDQISCLEGFHSVLNHFAPKMIAFSYTGMLIRLVLWNVFEFQSSRNFSFYKLLNRIINNYALVKPRRKVGLLHWWLVKKAKCPRYGAVWLVKIPTKALKFPQFINYYERTKLKFTSSSSGLHIALNLLLVYQPAPPKNL